MQVRLDHRDKPVRSPLTRWVHTPVDGKPYWSALQFDPPMPRKILGKGWPVWILHHRGREMIFASPEEIQHAISILSQKILPRARDLGRLHGAVNAHWLSRLHRSWMPWRVREQLVVKLSAALRL